LKPNIIVMKMIFPKDCFLGRLKIVIWILGLMVSCQFQQCTTQKVSRELIEVENAKKLNPRREYLKVHMKNGELYVLNNWKAEESMRFIEGMGTHLDQNRKPISDKQVEVSSAYPSSNQSLQKFRIPYDDIVIVETNDKGRNPGVAAMVVTSVLTVPVAIACIMNPKSCFGSCPTFYVPYADGEKLVAEGFSSSISQSLEERDVDRFNFSFASGPIEITMKNEALETHMIKSVNLLVCDKAPENMVYEARNARFFEVDSVATPQKAVYNSTSILEELTNLDEKEWYSLADSRNLASKEEILLEFDSFQSLNGLIIDKRQSLMTTFLFYQMLAFSGNTTSYLISAMETHKPKYQNRVSKMYELLGGIEVAIRDEKGNWNTVEEITESGPIASDSRLIPLPKVNSEKLQIRLRLTKGLWRINMVNLASIHGEVIPQRVQPDIVLANNSLDDFSLSRINDTTQYLVTYPGDEFRISFPVESSPSQQYFLESQGYYIEWMREEWLKEENYARVKWAMLFPSSFLKKTASIYKQNEIEMEAIFWSSKYANTGKQ